MARSIAMAALLAAGCADDVVKPACYAPCHPDKEVAGVGACALGITECDETGEVVGCIEYGTPSPEVCNNLDDDCDGVRDEFVEAPEGTCFSLGECALYAAVCADGSWICRYPSTVELQEESRCDSLDNDCDGMVDELPVNGFCYSGPVGSEQGECGPGWLQCQDGEWVCGGETLPAAETCNGLDDDCDGVADDGFDANLTDIVIGMDVSGSMPPFAAAVVAALDLVTSAAAMSGRRWGLVLYGTIYSPFWQEEIPLGPLPPVMSRMRSLSYIGGTEPTMDAIAETCLLAPWDPAARRVILAFADEVAQCLETQWCSPSAVARECDGVDVHVWTQFSVAPTYAGFATTHQIDWSPDSMVDDLAQIIGDGCGDAP